MNRTTVRTRIFVVNHPLINTISAVDCLTLFAGNFILDHAQTYVTFEVLIEWLLLRCSRADIYLVLHFKIVRGFFFQLNLLKFTLLLNSANKDHKQSRHFFQRYVVH